MFAAVACAGTCLARPGRCGPGPRGGFGPRPAMHHGGFRHHGGFNHHGGFYHHGGYRHHGGHYRGGYCGPRYYGGWGRGGRYFWPGFVGGVVGGAFYDAVVGPTVVAPASVVVAPTTTVYAPQTVWVEGRYVDQVQADGTIIRVWQPGHYEQR